MSRYIATRAIRGANALVNETEAMLQKALAEKGPDCKVAFPNTAYYLPTIFGMTGAQVETLGQLKPVLRHARSLLHPLPSDRRWTPYLGETLDSGMATLLAAETLEAIRFVYGLQPEPMAGMHAAAESFLPAHLLFNAKLRGQHGSGLTALEPLIVNAYRELGSGDGEIFQAFARQAYGPEPVSQ